GRARPRGRRHPGNLRRPRRRRGRGPPAGPGRSRGMSDTVRTVENRDRGPLGREEMAAIVARDIPPGSYVNLGIGQPTKVADHLSEDSGVVLHTENGMLRMGPAASGDEVDPDLTNAGKQPVTE